MCGYLFGESDTGSNPVYVFGRIRLAVRTLIPRGNPCSSINFMKRPVIIVEFTDDAMPERYEKALSYTTEDGFLTIVLSTERRRIIPANRIESIDVEYPA